MTSADRAAAILLLLFGVVVSVAARRLPYWTASAPGPGFLPFWLGVLLAACAAALLYGSIRGGSRADAGTSTDAARRVRALPYIGLTSGAAALSLVTGLVLASGIFIAVTLFYLRPGHARANWTTAALATLVIWLVFVRWLAVPLPQGPLGF